MNRAARVAEQTQRGTRGFYPRESRLDDCTVAGAAHQVSRQTADRLRSSAGAREAFSSLCYGLAAVVTCFVLVAVVFAFGCEHTVDFDKNKENGGAIIPSGALYASVVGTGMMDVSKPIEKVGSEEEALEAFFRARDLLAKGHRCSRVSDAKGNYAQAERLFEKSLRFFIPDLQAMVLGRNPVHRSANWHFLRALHDYWGTACALSGHSTNVDKIEENVKDAWALAVIQEMTKGMDEKERGRLIAGTFQSVKGGLVSQMERIERLSTLGKSASRQTKTEVALDFPFTEGRWDEVVEDKKGWMKMSRSYDLRMENIRKADEENEVQRKARMQMARNLHDLHLLVGDPANGRVYSVKAQN
ncbi:MAG: hypothetical protein WC740_01560 [Verrucomicrobiia bacterium]